MDEQFDTQTGEVFAPGMPPVIAAAIIAVKKQVKSLGFDDKNDHGKYKFVSVDKFYERIGPMMADAGLALLIDETASEVHTSDRPRSDGKDPPTWLFVQYNLFFMHESGIVSPMMRRSCALPISGPQAFGSAQSFTEKYFLRQIFKVPTGDKDGDDTAPSENSAPQRAAPRGPPARQEPAPPPSADKEEAQKRVRELQAEIRASMTIEDLDALATCDAWKACARFIVASEGVDVANNVMLQLRDRIEKQKAMLLGEGEYQ